MRRSNWAQGQALRWQAFALAIFAMLTGLSSGVYLLFGNAAVILTVKGLGLPWLFERVTTNDQPSDGALTLKLPVPLLFAGAVAIIAYSATIQLAAIVPPLMAPTLQLAIAGSMVGLFSMAVQRRGLDRLPGLLTTTNNISLVALLAVPSNLLITMLPLLIDLLAAALIWVSATSQPGRAMTDTTDGPKERLEA